MIDVSGNQGLIVSKFVLDEKPFENPLSWANSAIRNWLNYIFLHRAFTNAEKDIIIGKLIADGQQNFAKWTTNPSREYSTVDKVFLLSYEEAFEQYFPTNKSRQCGYEDCQNTYSCWWLRSVDYENNNHVVFVNTEGKAENDLVYSTESRGVRPAMWVDLDSPLFHE